jgi:(1->4)-alpha-D-glucan 1-alpha-D-glucosylmutase
MAGDRSFTEGQLREATIELAACFPVYRTYLRAEPAGGLEPSESAAADESALEVDVGLVRTAVDLARRECPDLEAAFELLRGLLMGRGCEADSADWVMRFQQLTGPAMAKGVEDTAYYCYNRFIALNEVGGDPSRFGLSLGGFHQACAEASLHWPQGMLTTSTHDTKRGEDVRARLAVLSEIPERWASAVRRWSAMNEAHREHGWPDRNAEYFFYQTLVGAWPLSVDRALACMEKAAREAAQHTNWIQRHDEYETALRQFVERTLADPGFREIGGGVPGTVDGCRAPQRARPGRAETHQPRGSGFVSRHGVLGFEPGGPRQPAPG